LFAVILSQKRGDEECSINQIFVVNAGMKSKESSGNFGAVVGFVKIVKESFGQRIGCRELLRG
jgi:hypothetical protein